MIYECAHVVLLIYDKENEMKDKMLVGFIVAAVAVTTLCLASISVDLMNADSSTGEERKISYPACNLAIYSDEEFALEAIKYLEPYTSKIITSKNINEKIDGEIILFDENWIYKNEKKAVNALIMEAYENGKPVLFIGSNNYMNLDSGIEFRASGYSLDSLGYGIFEDENGVGYSYGVGVTDKEATYEPSVYLCGWASIIVTSDSLPEDINKFSWM